MPINYPKQEGTGKFFYHTESQQGDLRIKILASTLKKGSEAGGFAAKPDQADKDFYIYKVMRPDRKEQVWTIKADSQIGQEMAKNNVLDGDIVRIHYLGMIMPTEYGMKAKYEVIKEGASVQQEPQPAPQPTPQPAPVNENLKQDVQDVFGSEPSQEVSEEVSIEDEF